MVGPIHLYFTISLAIGDFVVVLLSGLTMAGSLNVLRLFGVWNTTRVKVKYHKDLTKERKVQDH